MEVYTSDEIASHNNAKDLWIVIHGEVYNVTKFHQEHPGGEEVLLKLAGQDATECFEAIGHSNEAIVLRESYKIGKIANNNVSSDKKTKTMNTEVKESMEQDWQDQEPNKARTTFWSSTIMWFSIIIYAIIIYYWIRKLGFISGIF
ncbi:PREDICTED: cytochrome b5-like [Trachymyrmex septentrionalis]|uniref:cytochrome b5-like n=1 Tax=Trachymyrmex septentrionalis TaxID=34720 RepID=UPI00084F840C|nr:PREDICTED: cytochrome b5-like [Trachymyrmex septentrionalis]XP_018352335.1 PREDICTED: cytochrome b5-like [Trachymyrmex septentrionalis]XP_018352336.1 PREDICTED: cytochrome b5-like [Trachymyrmex septentrionalis]XP_018352337.1 PREDICTED: cytochrome b5-like [Trachymyrmex septentrionalis]XP_018352338.1 PREDICTED: cytochrome b5-like [Trachymyrmex septentrionalis]